MSTGTALSLLPDPDPSSVLIFSQYSRLWRFTESVSSSLHVPQNPILYSHLRHRVTRSVDGPRYSSAGNFRAQSRFSFRSGDIDEDEEEEAEEEDGVDFGRRQRQRRWRGPRRRWWSEEEDDEKDQGSGVLEEVLDSIWIFKVFGSYGWMLPAIILSLLLSNGPKAFLTALAFPIGQSLLSLAFNKLWSNTQNNPKRKAKSKRQPFGTTRTVQLEEDEEKEEEKSQKTKRGRMEYQSWVSRDSQNTSTFGGWDELDRSKEFGNGSPRTAQQGLSRKTRMEKGKFSRREGKMIHPYC
ncbi:hypothetical protein NMG60_11031883 [Bertholletia excelsa]